MHDQVGIPPDRRSEVRVAARGQREVAEVFFGVARLLERAQHQVAQDAFFRLACDFGGQLLVHARGDVNVLGNFDGAPLLAHTAGGAAVALELHAVNGQRAYAQGISEGRSDHFEIVNPLGIGFFVNPIQRCDALRFQILRHALVGREHELLDQTMSDVALRAGNAFHQAEFVELNHRLGQVEVNRSAALPFAVEDQRQIAHELEGGNQSCVTFARGCIAFEHGIDGSVGHALSGTNYTFAQLVADDFAARIDLHHAREHEPVEVRAQAADIGR